MDLLLEVTMGIGMWAETK